MLQEIQSIVYIQGQKIEKVEKNVNEAKKYQEKTQRRLNRAIEHQSQTKKIKYCIIVLSIVILSILAITSISKIFT